MQRIEERSGNVVIAATIIALIIIVASFFVLLLLTNDAYLDAYYIIDTFFDAPNSAATWNLAELVLSYSPLKFGLILGIVVIDSIGRLLIVSFIVAVVIDIVAYANLEKIISIAHAKRMKGHYIICGYNPLSERLIARLTERKKRPKIVVIDDDEKVIIELHHRHIPAIEGNCSSARSLELASVSTAKTIIFAKQNDSENLIGAIEAKKANKNIKVIVRATKEDVMTKMYRAGVDMCVLPESLAGVGIGEFILKHAKVQK